MRCETYQTATELQEKGYIMYKKELFGIFSEMKQELGEKSLLDELFDALSDDALDETLKYIADNYDLGYLFED